MADVEIPAECSICLENVDTNTMLQLGCLHCFHRGCIDEWFRRAPRRTCPLCRAEFPDPARPAGIALFSFIAGGLLLVAAYVTLFLRAPPRH